MFYAIKKTSIEDETINEKYTLNRRYLTFTEEFLPKCLRKYAKKKLVRYKSMDYHKACQEHFKKDYKNLAWRGHPLLTCFLDENGMIGKLTDRQLKKYFYTEDRLEYVIPVKYLGCPYGTFSFNLPEGVYSGKRVANELIRAILDTGCYHCEEMVKTLSLVLKEAWKGEKIYVYID